MATTSTKEQSAVEGSEKIGWSDPKEATTEIQFISALFKRDVCERLNLTEEKLPFYKALQFCSMASFGLEYLIKVAVGTRIVHLYTSPSGSANNGKPVRGFELTGFKEATLEEPLKAL